MRRRTAAPVSGAAARRRADPGRGVERDPATRQLLNRSKQTPHRGEAGRPKGGAGPRRLCADRRRREAPPGVRSTPEPERPSRGSNPARAPEFSFFPHQRRRPPRHRHRPESPVFSSAASIPSPRGARSPSVHRRRRPSSWSRGNPSPPPGFFIFSAAAVVIHRSGARFFPSTRRPAAPAFPSERRPPRSPPLRSVSVPSPTAAVVQRDPVPVFPSTTAAQLLPFHPGDGPPRSPPPS